MQVGAFNKTDQVALIMSGRNWLSDGVFVCSETCHMHFALDYKIFVYPGKHSTVFIRGEFI